LYLFCGLSAARDDVLLAPARLRLPPMNTGSADAQTTDYLHARDMLLLTMAHYSHPSTPFSNLFRPTLLIYLFYHD
jgi:hypothetical protein